MAAPIRSRFCGSLHLSSWQTRKPLTFLPRLASTSNHGPADAMHLQHVFDVWCSGVSETTKRFASLRMSPTPMVGGLPFLSVVQAARSAPRLKRVCTGDRARPPLQTHSCLATTPLHRSCEYSRYFSGCRTRRKVILFVFRTVNKISDRWLIRYRKVNDEHTSVPFLSRADTLCGRRF